MLFRSLLVSAAAVASVTADSVGNSRSLATLAQKWNITEPTFDYSSLSFDLDYQVSDFIKEGMASFSLWDKDCKEGAKPVTTGVFNVEQSDLVAEQGSGDDKQTLELSITVDPEVITSDPNIYQETTILGQLFAIVTFCVRIELYTPGTSRIEVNFLETLITLNVDLTDGFEIGGQNAVVKEITGAPVDFPEDVVEIIDQTGDSVTYNVINNWDTDGPDGEDNPPLIWIGVEQNDGIGEDECELFTNSNFQSDINGPDQTFTTECSSGYAELRVYVYTGSDPAAVGACNRPAPNSPDTTEYIVEIPCEPPISVAPKEVLLKTANQVYELEAYQCGRDYQELTEAGKAVTRNQGAIIRVCVRPNDEARPDGIYMREVTSFTFSREDPPAEQKAVENAQAAGNGLTELFCGAGYEICMFETILFANFYRVSGTVAGSGIASMQFGGSTARRALRAGERSLQDDDVAGTAEFELDFETNAAVDTGSTSGATTFGSVLMFAMLAAMGTVALS